MDVCDSNADGNHVDVITQVFDVTLWFFDEASKPISLIAAEAGRVDIAPSEFKPE